MGTKQGWGVASVANTVEPLLFDPFWGITIRSDNRKVE